MGDSNRMIPIEEEPNRTPVINIQKINQVLCGEDPFGTCGSTTNKVILQKTCF